MTILLACAATTASYAAPDDAQAMVHQASDRMIAALKTEREAIKANPARLFTLVEEIVLPHFDFERMSRWVLGKHWRTASAAQRVQFVQEFRPLLVRTYATAMAEYRDQKIVYMPLKADAAADEVTIRSEVRTPGGPPIPVSYSAYMKGSEWKVYDVTIDGVSMAVNYRTTFSHEIRQGGLDALIDKLATRNQQKGKDSALTLKTNSAAIAQ
ncbi:MAG: ABC transporter substrate-binding protein [Proteobacteria bacterium]|nr:ABC transporter substrate-binding protein [Pseudomonadota bacterium]